MSAIKPPTQHLDLQLGSFEVRARLIVFRHDMHKIQCLQKIAITGGTHICEIRSTFKYTVS